MKLKALGLGVALAALPLGYSSVASADTFTFTSCHITGGCPSTGFGTVTLTQSGTSVNFDVVLNNGNRFVETGAGGGELFLFNDTLSVGGGGSPRTPLMSTRSAPSPASSIESTRSVTSGLA